MHDRTSCPAPAAQIAVALRRGFRNLREVARTISVLRAAAGLRARPPSLFVVEEPGYGGPASSARCSERKQERQDGLPDHQIDPYILRYEPAKILNFVECHHPHIVTDLK